MSMATLSQVRAAAKRKYGKRCGVEVRKNAPGPVPRQKAIEQRRELIARINELNKKLPASKDEELLKAICKAARFVCDTDGDKTAVEELYCALRSCEEHLDRKEDRRDAIKLRDALTATAHGRYRYSITNISTLIPGFPVCEILHEADTLDELMNKLEPKKVVA